MEPTDMPDHTIIQAATCTGMSPGLCDHDFTVAHPSPPAYWLGVGLAPHFSRPVAAAYEAVRQAEEKLLEALRTAYPMGARVAVIHYRGHFNGHVVGWDRSGCRVLVKNERTLKTSKWWAAHVQITP